LFDRCGGRKTGGNSRESERGRVRGREKEGEREREKGRETVPRNDEYEERNKREREGKTVQDRNGSNVCTHTGIIGSFCLELYT